MACEDIHFVAHADRQVKKKTGSDLPVIWTILSLVRAIGMLDAMILSDVLTDRLDLLILCAAFVSWYCCLNPVR